MPEPCTLPPEADTKRKPLLETLNKNLIFVEIEGRSQKNIKLSCPYNARNPYPSKSEHTDKGVVSKAFSLGFESLQKIFFAR